MSARPVREALAWRYLRGDGLEVGALNAPLAVPSHARVRYVDRLSDDDQRKHYPELASKPLVHVDVIDDGEKLHSVLTNSVSFVIANHVIEHCEDPIATLQNWLRVLNAGGVVFMAVPDMRFTFDAERQRTTLDHLIADHREGPERSRIAHYDEWVEHVEHVKPDDRAARRQHLIDIGYSIHFHAWTYADVVEWLLYCQNVEKMGFEIEAIQREGIELVTVLRKVTS